MNNPPHPGEFIRQVYLEPFDMQVQTVAATMDITSETLTRLLNGESSVTPDMAQRLSQTLGRSLQSWLAMQADYDHWQARHSLNAHVDDEVKFWNKGDTVVLRNIARSDGSVTTAVPAIVIRDAQNLLVVYIAKGTPFKNNWVILPEQRAASVAAIVPSAQRQHRNLLWWQDSIRLYLPGYSYSVWLNFDEAGQFAAWYCNLEAPFVRTPLGIDTRDFALDIVAKSDGQWWWKDEDEFERRLEAGLDSPEHQARVRAAGRDFIRRFESGDWPFNCGWEQWQPPDNWQIRDLPENWAVEYGSHTRLL